MNKHATWIRCSKEDCGRACTPVGKTTPFVASPDESGLVLFVMTVRLPAGWAQVLNEDGAQRLCPEHAPTHPLDKGGFPTILPD
jgi:hypothetical protein